MSMNRFAAAALLIVTPALAQNTDDPFPNPINTSEGLVIVGYGEFASLPDVDGAPARPMLLVDEPGSGRMFVNEMTGPLYTVTYSGRVSLYLDVKSPAWGIPVEASGRERGMQSFALHPQFNEQGTPGYGKLYIWTDTEDTGPTPDFTPGGGQDAHDTVLLEWTALNPEAGAYDGGLPRQLIRLEQPFGNHNGGRIAFNPHSAPGDADFGMLYVGIADGGSGGDPMDLAQNLGSAFGKIFRIDPLGSNSANGLYGVPSDNPYAQDENDRTLGEIYASGLRNPQQFGWDPENGNFFVADIGQNIVEKLSLVTAGANLGWNSWEGSFRFVSRSAVDLANPRGEAGITYPVAEYGQLDPLLQRQAAVTGVVVHREGSVPQLQDRVLFGDFPSGEIFHIDADDLPRGGQNAMGRVLFRTPGGSKTLLQLIQTKNAEQGRDVATRSDLHFGTGPAGRVFVLNKQDGVIREIVR
jgi:hypothetical protein